MVEGLGEGTEERGPLICPYFELCIGSAKGGLCL